MGELGEEIEEIEFDSPFESPSVPEPAAPDRELEPA